MKNKLRIVHGTTDHGHAERLDCLTCLDVEIEYLQALRKAGGKSKFIADKLSELKKINTILEKEEKKNKLTPIKCDHCGKEVERWKACSCCEEK